MGKRGPSPKPTEAKKRAGNPGKRPLNKTEPKPKPATRLTPPTYLTPVGKRKFVQLGKALKEMNLLTQVDLDQLAVYCVNFQTFVTAEKEIQRLEKQSVESGFLQRSPVSQTDSIHPRVKIRNEAMAKMLAIGKEFGFTPSARSNLNVVPEEIEKQIIEDFLFGP